MMPYDVEDLNSTIMLSYNDHKLKISANNELINDHNHNFALTITYEFILSNNTYIKNILDPKNDIEDMAQYFRECKLKFQTDLYCKNILDKKHEQDEEAALALKSNIHRNQYDVIDYTIPGFASRKLKPYQKESVMHMLHTPHAANFSIPGSGKTTMTYAVFSMLKLESKIDILLVIGPIPSFRPWEEEYTNCFGKPFNENVLRYSGSQKERKELRKNMKKYDVILCSFMILHKEISQLQKYLFSDKRIMMVLDESHHIKSFRQNARLANSAIDVGRLAKKRIILTGTPMPRDWEDLWSQITFLYPGEQVLGSRDRYQYDLNQLHDPKSITKKIQNLWSRVSMRQLSEDLPKKHDHNQDIILSRTQEIIYREIENDWDYNYENSSSMDIITKNELRRTKTLRLLQCVTNPKTILLPDEDFNLESYSTDNIKLLNLLRNYKEVPKKIQIASKMAIDLINKNKNVIIWTVFRHNVNSVCKQLKKLNSRIEPISISGEIPIESNLDKYDIGRDDRIAYFKDNPGQVMVATVGSIAESVSLHRNRHGNPVCQNAIYLERGFNAGQFIQSLFRIYRIGTDSSIPIHNTFLTGVLQNGTNTIDHEVHRRLTERTQRMFKMLNDDIKLLDISTESYKIDDKTQFHDEAETGDLENRIHRMIKKHNTGKNDI